jgi:hypothetical protein
MLARPAAHHAGSPLTSVQEFTMTASGFADIASPATLIEQTTDESSQNA